VFNRQRTSDCEWLLHWMRLKLSCRGACAKRLGVRRGECPKNALVLRANRAGTSDLFLDCGWITGVGHFAGTSDNYFQRIGNCNLGVARTGESRPAADNSFTSGSRRIPHEPETTAHHDAPRFFPTRRAPEKSPASASR